MAVTDTVLVIDGMGVPTYSARGLTQTLTPIPAALSARRTINGELVNLAATQFRKYQTRISCSDTDAPALDGIWPGMEVDVSCIVELSYETSTGGATRDVVAGSSRISGNFTFYRPRLRMMVMNFETTKDEWGAVVSWSLDLEEV